MINYISADLGFERGSNEESTLAPVSNFLINQGFKLSINDYNEIEKLEFENYILEIENENSLKFNNYDKNTLTIFDDIKNSNYLNISYKIFDVIIIFFIMYFFYQNNISNFNFNLKNNIFFITISIFMLLINQLIKNSEIELIFYVSIICMMFLMIILWVRMNRI